MEALNADHTAGRGGAAWGLAGRVENAAQNAAMVAASFTAGKIRGEALALAQQRREIEAIRAKGVGRSWKDVASGNVPNWGKRAEDRGMRREDALDRTMGGAMRAANGVRRRGWDPCRTVFLSPTDASATRRHIDQGLFGVALGRAIGAREPGTLVRTGAGLFKVELEREAASTVLESGSVEVPGFGTWRASRMHASSAPSVVVTGVDPSMSDEAVTTGLITSMREILGEEDRRRLGSLRVRRMFQGSRGGDSARVHEAECGEGAPRTPTPTRSVRVYADPMLLARFEAMGEVKLHWALLPCRPYVPRQFYCQICGRLGGHSTDHHRGSVREGERRSRHQAGGRPHP